VLPDRNRRGQTLDLVHVRFFQTLQISLGGSAEAFYITPLPLGIEGVEGEGRLPRATDAGDDGEALLRQFDRDVFQVMLPCAGDADDAVGGRHFEVLDKMECAVP
jgi:hypothetical protein